MVKKLYKHEFLAWLRIMGVIWVITLVVAGLHRILQLFESDVVSYKIVFGFGIFIYVITLFASFISPVALGVIRFYRHLFSGEGYLTFTLPVTKRALLWVKLSTAVCMSAITFVVSALSLMLITAGDALNSFFREFGAFFATLDVQDTWHMVGYILELCLMLLVSAGSTYLMYYSCICLGHLFQKHRIVGAVAVYFGYYVLTQILSTIFTIVTTIMAENGAFDDLALFFLENPETSVHLFLLGTTLFTALIGAIHWFICRWVINKRLNLE